jgi:hypothetical protein
MEHSKKTPVKESYPAKDEVAEGFGAHPDAGEMDSFMEVGDKFA